MQLGIFNASVPISWNGTERKNTSCWTQNESSSLTKINKSRNVILFPVSEVFWLCWTISLRPSLIYSISLTNGRKSNRKKSNLFPDRSKNVNIIMLATCRWLCSIFFGILVDKNPSEWTGCGRKERRSPILLLLCEIRGMLSSIILNLVSCSSSVTHLTDSRDTHTNETSKTGV